MSDYPAWLTPPDGPEPEVEVHWAALPADWRARSYREGTSASRSAPACRILPLRGLLAGKHHVAPAR